MNPQDPKYQHKSKTISSAVSRAKLLCSLCYETPCNAWKFSSLFLSCQHAKIKKLLYSQSERLWSHCEWCDSPFFSLQVPQENLWISMLLSVEEINRYLLLVFQFVLSMASAFAFGYLAPFYFYGTIAVGPRLLYGIISAFVVGMADLYFVIRHLLLMEGVIEKPTIDSRDNMIDSQIKKDIWF